MVKLLFRFKYFSRRIFKDRMIQSLAARYMLLKARLTNRAFYCNALQGNSDGNICINSDMTVSCNCQDYDGKSQIGDLKTQSLEQIFHGTRANHFRKTLASGHFPLSECFSCRDLLTENKYTIKNIIKEYHAPDRGIMVENTALCNLKCLCCQRDKIVKTRKKLKMSLADMEKVAIEIRANDIKEIHFFGLGEPFLSNTVQDEIDILRKYNQNAYLITSTNGVYLDTNEKLEAALKLDLIFFSIDGVTQEQLTKYQVGGDFALAYANMKKLVELRNMKGLKIPIIEWKYVLFDWNDTVESIEKAIQLAKEAGVDIISFWPGGISPQHISRRFWLDPYFQSLGTKSWKGREIDFRKTELPKSAEPEPNRKNQRPFHTDTI